MTEQLIHCRNLGYQIDQHKILNNINYEIPVGKFQIILGANGVGKTTLLKVLAGLLTKTSGQVEKQTDLVTSYLGHQSQLYMDLSVRQNLNFISEFFEITFKQDELLRKWGLLDQAKLRLRHLSQGQLKRLSLLVALEMKANLYILDEPSSNLDRLGKDLLAQEIARLNKNPNISLIIITHELGEYFELADQIYYLSADSFQMIYNKSAGFQELSVINNLYLNLLRS